MDDAGERTARCGGQPVRLEEERAVSPEEADRLRQDIAPCNRATRARADTMLELLLSAPTG